MIAFDLILFVLLIGLFGLLSHEVLFQSSQRESGMLEWFTFRLLSGLGTLSVVLLIAAFTGFFFKTVIFASLGILVLLFAFRWFRRSSKTNLLLFRYFVFCFCIGLSSFAVTTFTRPYQAIIFSHDATVYVACAFQLADSGAIHYADPVVLEMDDQERRAIFLTRSGYARFKGGVQIWDVEKGIVNFNFLPFFPVWLAFAILFLGTQEFLSLLSFLTVLGVLLLYLTGKRLSGPLLGLLVPAVLFFFLPQFYFSRLPLTEGCAQVLFLSGLFVFTGGSSAGHQRLAGILWGSLILCRLEILFLLPITLVLLFTLHPQYRGKWDQWRIFILILVGFAMSLFCFQLVTKTYLSVWGLTKRPLMTMLWLPTVTFLHDFIRTQWGSLVFLSFVALFLAGLHWLLKKRIDNKYDKWISASGVVLVAIVVLSLTGSQFNWKQVGSNASNVALYIPGPFLAALLAGYVFLLFKKVRQGNDHFVLTLILFFLLPAFFFVCRPLVIYYQPLFVRRFVVAAIPLFFLLSLAGWYGLLQMVIRPPIVARSIFLILTLWLANSFYLQSAFIIHRPLFADVIPQIEKLAERIPADALVVIPKRESGFHIALPLQYMVKRDTVSVPSYRENAAAFDLFLKRQLQADREIFILSLRPLDKVSPLLSNFVVEHEFSEKLVFFTVPDGRVDRLPKRSKKILRFHGYRVLHQPVKEIQQIELNEALGRQQKDVKKN